MLKNQVPLRESNDIVIARQACREIGHKLGFGSADQTRLATAVSEIARNIIKCKGNGVCVIANESNREESKIRIVVEYHGPGIDGLNEAIKCNLPTTSRLAAGLQSAKRLVHYLELESKPGNATITLTMRKR